MLGNAFILLSRRLQPAGPPISTISARMASVTGKRTEGLRYSSWTEEHFLINAILHALTVPVLPSPSPILWPPFIRLHSCAAQLHAQSPFSSPGAPLLPPIRRHPEEVAATMAAAAVHGLGGRSWGSVVIIIQMRGAKLEPCPSPSGWLTVTNSSLIHPDHQLYTGQRRPERQEEARRASPPQRKRLGPSSSFCLRDSRRRRVTVPVRPA